MGVGVITVCTQRGPMESCVETRAQKDMMRGVYRVVYLVQRLIDCHVCSTGSQSGGLVRGGGEHF